MKISYLGAVTGLLAVYLQACTVYQPYPQSSSSPAYSPLPEQRWFNLISGLTHLETIAPVKEVEIYTEGTMPNDAQPFAYIHSYELLAPNSWDYLMQIKAIKDLAKTHGADAIVRLQVTTPKDVLPNGQMVPYGTKLITGKGIKYVRNLNQFKPLLKSQITYEVKDGVPVEVAVTEYGLHGKVAKMTGDLKAKTQITNILNAYSPYELIDDREGWKYHANSEGRIEKRKEKSMVFPKRNLTLTYDDQGRVEQVIIQYTTEAYSPIPSDTVWMGYDQQGRYVSTMIRGKNQSKRIDYTYEGENISSISVYELRQEEEKPLYKIVNQYFTPDELIMAFAKDGLLVDKRPNTQLPTSPNPTYITSGQQNSTEPANVPSYAAPMTASVPTELSAGLPRHVAPKPDAVAVVIGNQTYRHKDIPSVSYALNDANMVKKYLVEAYGFREENIIYLENATLSDFNAVFGNEAIHTGKLYSYVKPGQSDVFVYYSGHGAPDLANKQGYFVPADADASMVGLSGYPVSRMFANLSKIPYKSLTVVLDACFSGASEGGMLIREASPVYLKSSVQVMNDEKSMVFLSSAGDQVSSWYGEKQHSLFTYYFLKGLQGSADENGDGTVFLQEMKDYLEKEVVFRARKLHNRQQTPEVYGVPTNILIQQK